MSDTSIPYEASKDNFLAGNNYVIMFHKFNESYSFLFSENIIKFNIYDMDLCRCEVNECLSLLGFSADFAIPLRNNGLCAFNLKKLENAVQ